MKSALTLHTLMAVLVTTICRVTSSWLQAAFILPFWRQQCWNVDEEGLRP